MLIPGTQITPTFEEWFQSTLYFNPFKIWNDRTGETAFYFDINMSLALVYGTVKGMDTLTAYRFYRVVTLTPHAALVGGAITLGVLSAYSAHADSTPEEKVRSLGGLDLWQPIGGI